MQLDSTIAAVVTGLFKLVFSGMGWELQAIVFAICAVCSTIIWLILWRRRPIDTDKPDLNARGERMIGRQLTLDEPMVNGEGMAKIGDTLWKIRGPDFMRGAKVKIVELQKASNAAMKDAPPPTEPTGAPAEPPADKPG